MSTFQYLVDALSSSLSWIWPTAPVLVDDLHVHLLGWGMLSVSLVTLVSTSVFAYLAFFFRYDLLGIFSAILKTLFQPGSLGTERRTLDQHIVLFFLIVFGIFRTLALMLQPYWNEMELLSHPLIKMGALFVLAFGFHFSKNWNKRLKGLNHLQLSDAFWIGLLGLLSASPIFPWLGLLWIGFALTNYHFESIIKYSMLLLTFDLGRRAIYLLMDQGFMESIRSVGYLNAIAVVVVSLTTVHLFHEYLHRNMNEGTFAHARNFSILTALFYGAYSFL
jgi:hypothetical protein